MRKKYWMDFNLFIDYLSFYLLMYYSFFPSNPYFSLKLFFEYYENNVGIIDFFTS